MVNAINNILAASFALDFSPLIILPSILLPILLAPSAEPLPQPFVFYSPVDYALRGLKSSDIMSGLPILVCLSQGSASCKGQHKMHVYQ